MFMKKSLLMSLAALLCFSLLAADSTPKETVEAGIKTLAEKANYSWKATTVVPEDAPFKPGPVEGQAEKEGFTYVKLATFGDNNMEMLKKGDKVAASTQDGWKTPKEMESDEGFGRFIGMMAKNFKAPAEQAKQALSFTKELKKDGESFASDLTEEGAKTMLAFGGATVTNPKGSVKFWLKDGVLTKYEIKLKATMSFNGNDFENDRTTTTEIKEVGTTKVTVPEEGKKKIS